MINWKAFWGGLSQPWLTLTALLMIWLLVLNACASAPTAYTHPTKTTVEFDADRYACNQDAALYVGQPSAETVGGAVVVSLMARQRMTRRFYECMTVRGWTGPGAHANYSRAVYGGAA